jgi:zinc transport system substrate-binding protein
MKKIVSILFASSLLLAACASTETTTSPTADPVETTVAEKIQIVAGFYPLAYAAESIAGDLADVISLAGPGVDAHDLELTASDVAKITDADLVIYIPNFIPALDAVIKTLDSSKVINATEGITLLEGKADSHSHEGHSDDEHSDDEHSDDEHSDEGLSDPHVWLTPKNMITLGGTIAQAIGAIQANDQIATNQASFESSLTALAGEYSTKLANCSVKAMIVSHEAFGYLAKEYGFEQVGISGLSPEAEPSPARLAEVAKIAKAKQATTIYYETLVDPKVAKTLAEELKISAAKLDPLESPPATGDYLSAMQENLGALFKGQVCS